MEKPSVQREAVESGSEHSAKSWRQRHGATIIAVTVVALLASLMTFQTSC
jgi:hypothetical protein